ncbi:MAG TPA: arginine--tRNA ligase [Planctomycetaceae bacterium]|nr:arginine--tRNA ligase [Planctomycetaceae bacterium]
MPRRSNPLSGGSSVTNFRRAFRDVLAGVLEQAVSGGDLKISSEEIPVLLEQVRETVDPKFGDFTATLAMPLAKKMGVKPRDLASDLIARINKDQLFGECFQPIDAPVGPGFINVRVLDQALADGVRMACCNDRLGVAKVPQPQTIVLDYSSPNVAKPMHVGHIRSTVIGDALSRILRFHGHSVITDNHLGDWGTQFGMILWGWKHCRDDSAYEENPTQELGRLYRLVRKVVDADSEELAHDSIAAGLAEKYPDARQEVLAETVKLHEGDLENNSLWKQFMPACREEIERVYSRLDVTFDHTMGESCYQPLLAGVVDDLTARGMARESRGAVGVFLEGYESPLLVQKADGAFLYATTDLATLAWRAEHWKPDRILYIVDHRQSQHFKQVFATARAWGCRADEQLPGIDLIHVAFGTVLGEDGKPFKTRAGDAVGLEALLDEGVQRASLIVGEGEQTRQGMDDARRQEVAEAVGIGAIKYADLSQNRTTDYVFSFDKMLELKGNTAAYMQYAVARVEGIVARGGVDRELLRREAADDPSVLELSDPLERRLALTSLRFAAVLEDVELDYRPNVMTSWLYELASCFSSFYDALSVLKAEGNQRTTRLVLCDLTGRTLRKGMELLGIRVPNQM